MGKKARLRIVVIFLVVWMAHFQVLAEASPLAELYYYNHDAVGSTPAINTTPYGSSTSSELHQMGYDSHRYTNVLAGPKTQASIIRTLDDDAVVMVRGHAGPGRMFCVNSSGTITRLSAKAVNDNSVYSLAYNFDNTSNKLNDVKIAIFFGCHTHETSSTYGCLANKLANLGVDCAVTHHGNSYTDSANYFVFALIRSGQYSYTVSTCLAKAREATFTHMGVSPSDISSYCYQTVWNNYITGANSYPGTVKFTPASYGS